MSQSGRVVGDYLVGRHMNIGTGSFSVLWEAKHSLFTGLMWLSRRYLWPGLTRSFRTVSCLRFLSSEDQSSQLHPFARRGRGYTSKSGPLYGTRTKTRFGLGGTAFEFIIWYFRSFFFFFLLWILLPSHLL
ncbi:unnamed protein product [Brassica rapa subsp. narinosa]